MIKVSVLYPQEEGKSFDAVYYTNKHVPMVQDKLGAACKQVTVDLGLSGADPDSKPAFICMTHMLFDSLEAFQAAFGPHAMAIMADLPNCTDIEPVIQISDTRDLSIGG